MKSNLDRINQIQFLDIFTKLGIQTKRNSDGEYLIETPEGKMSDGSYRLNIKKNVVFCLGATRPHGTPFLFVRDYNGSDDRTAFKWFEDHFDIKTSQEKPTPNIPKKNILENLPNYLLGSSITDEQMGQIKMWLGHRGFTFDQLADPQVISRIREVFSTVGFCENPGTKQDSSGQWIQTKPVIVFPSLDQNGKIIGAKMRKINNLPEDEAAGGTKSINITGSKSGVIYTSLGEIKNAKKIIIVEGEADYIILRMLGFKNVIGNIGGANACREIIRDLTRYADRVVVAYDNDETGKMAYKKLREFCNRDMHRISYIDRKDQNGKPYKDINDYFEGGFTYDDIRRMLKKKKKKKSKGSKKLSPSLYSSKSEKIKFIMKDREAFIYLRKYNSYYDTYENKLVKKDAVSHWMRCKQGDLLGLVLDGTIKEYYDTCYLKGWRLDHHNILDENLILSKSSTPEIHPDIKFLIDNLCGYSKKNIEWLHKAILYKYTHINDVLVPAVLFKGVGGSGKGTFMRLLSKMFSQENVMSGLGTNSLLSDFCPYTGNKLVVEINELCGGTHRDAIRILDRIKSLVFEPRIMANMKGVQAMEVDNIAWFIMSSNHQKPLQLDSEQSGNRRFTIINTGGSISPEKGKKVNSTIENKKSIANYLAWLYKEFPEVPGWDSISCLDNEDKRLLTDQSENTCARFFKWFEWEYPNINKITIKERNKFIIQYRKELSEDTHEWDKAYDPRFINSNLPHHIIHKSIRVRDIISKGYYIKKEVEGQGCFESSIHESIDQSLGF